MCGHGDATAEAGTNSLRPAGSRLALALVRGVLELVRPLLLKPERHCVRKHLLVEQKHVRRRPLCAFSRSNLCEPVAGRESDVVARGPNRPAVARAQFWPAGRGCRAQAQRRRAPGLHPTTMVSTSSARSTRSARLRRFYNHNLFHRQEARLTARGGDVLCIDVVDVHVIARDEFTVQNLLAQRILDVALQSCYNGIDFNAVLIYTLNCAISALTSEGYKCQLFQSMRMRSPPGSAEFAHLTCPRPSISKGVVKCTTSFSPSGRCRS